MIPEEVQEIANNYESSTPHKGLGPAIFLAGYSLRANEERWVRVEEELPGNDNPIMLFDGSEVFQGWYEEGDQFYYGGNQRAFAVTHWQPLPSPPTE